MGRRSFVRHRQCRCRSGVESMGHESSPTGTGHGLHGGSHVPDRRTGIGGTFRRFLLRRSFWSWPHCRRICTPDSCSLIDARRGAGSGPYPEAHDGLMIGAPSGVWPALNMLPFFISAFQSSGAWKVTRGCFGGKLMVCSACAREAQRKTAKPRNWNTCIMVGGFRW